MSDPITKVHEAVEAHQEALKLAQSYGFSSVLQAVTTAGQYIKGVQPDIAPSAASAAAPVSGQGASIDTAAFRKLTYTYAEALMKGTVPQTSKAWEALVTFIDSHPRSEDSRAKVLEEVCQALATQLSYPTEACAVVRTLVIPPKTYLVTITFDDGIFEGRATSSSDFNAYQLVLQDARMGNASGPQHQGKVIDWTTKVVTS